MIFFQNTSVFANLGAPAGATQKLPTSIHEALNSCAAGVINQLLTENPDAINERGTTFLFSKIYCTLKDQ